MTGRQGRKAVLSCCLILSLVNPCVGFVPLAVPLRRCEGLARHSSGVTGGTAANVCLWRSNPGFPLPSLTREGGKHCGRAALQSSAAGSQDGSLADETKAAVGSGVGRVYTRGQVALRTLTRIRLRLWRVLTSLWWLWFAPFGIAGYLSSVHHLAGLFKACPQCFDPANIMLFSFPFPFFGRVPVCGWNLSHLAMYYVFMRCIPFKRFNSNHAFALSIGVLWYYVEPHIFTLLHPEAALASHACKTIGMIPTVYSSTWKPRVDDFVFNTGGQLLYEAHRYVRGRRLKPGKRKDW